MVNNKPHFAAVAAALVFPLAGCGGGGNATQVQFDSVTSTSSTTLPGTAEGLYAGTASNGRYFNTLVLENNQYYIVYGGLAGDAFSPSGLITGTGQAASQSFTSTDLREFPELGLPLLGVLSGTYSPAVSFNAIATTRGTAVTYAGTAFNDSHYVYTTPAKLSDIAGAWDVVSGAGLPVSLSISSGGIFTGTSAGCNFSGTIAPRASGKNVFDVTMHFGSAPCALADQTVTGNAVTYLLASGKRRLLVAASDAARNFATVLTGMR